MDLKRLKYSKSEGTVEPGQEEHVTSTKEGQQTSSLVPDVTKFIVNYSKEEPTVETKIVFVISGGEDKEKNYFHLLQKDKNIRRLKVAFSSKRNQGLNPQQMHKKALQYINNKRFITSDGNSYNIADDDVIYMLQDVDEYKPSIKKLMTENISDNIQWIISNPAFEIWLFYHYFDNPEPLSEGASIPVKTRSQWLKKKLNALIPGGADPVKSFEKIDIAIANSIKNYDKKEDFPILYATQMHMLAKEIKDIMGNEFDGMLARKAKQVKEFIAKTEAKQSKRINISTKKINLFINDLSHYADISKIQLPGIEKEYAQSLPIIDIKAFPQSLKLKKEFFKEGSNEDFGNMPEIFIENINQEISNYYVIQYLLRPAEKSVTINSDKIYKAFESLGLNDRYCILTSIYIAQKDLRKYGDIQIYKLKTDNRMILIVRKEYMPRMEIKTFEGTNPEYTEVDSAHLIYSNIQNMKELSDGYGLSVMRVVRFFYPQESNFRSIRLNISDFPTNDEIKQLNQGDMIRLQFEEGDFIRIKEEQREKYTNNSIYNDKVFEIEKIKDNGTVKLRFIDQDMPYEFIEPVPIDGIADKQIYYNPIYAGSINKSGDPKPTHYCQEKRYYLESFKLKNESFEDESTLYQKFEKAKLQYVHEVQHWLKGIFGGQYLSINHSLKITNTSSMTIP
jgi:hypothetical protein